MEYVSDGNVGTFNWIGIICYMSKCIHFIPFRSDLYDDFMQKWA